MTGCSLPLGNQIPQNTYSRSARRSKPGSYIAISMRYDVTSAFPAASELHRAICSTMCSIRFIKSRCTSAQGVVIAVNARAIIMSFGGLLCKLLVTRPNFSARTREARYHFHEEAYDIEHCTIKRHALNPRRERILPAF